MGRDVYGFMVSSTSASKSNNVSESNGSSSNAKPLLLVSVGEVGSVKSTGHARVPLCSGT